VISTSSRFSNPALLNASVTTASSSIGLIEQVEYNISPPTLSNDKPLIKIDNYKGCKIIPSLV